MNTYTYTYAEEREDPGESLFSFSCGYSPRFLPLRQIIEIHVLNGRALVLLIDGEYYRIDDAISGHIFSDRYDRAIIPLTLVVDKNRVREYCALNSSDKFINVVGKIFGREQTKRLHCDDDFALINPTSGNNSDQIHNHKNNGKTEK